MTAQKEYNFPRVLICGSRTFCDTNLLFDTMDRLAAKFHIRTVIHGNARGADRIADAWAHERNLEVIVFRAQWKQLGLGAGPARNTRMLVESKPDYLAAFVDKELKMSVGTNDMVSKALRAHVPMSVYQPLGVSRDRAMF